MVPPPKVVFPGNKFSGVLQLIGVFDSILLANGANFGRGMGGVLTAATQNINKGVLSSSNESLRGHV
jgi:hypothetical protein